MVINRTKNNVLHTCQSRRDLAFPCIGNVAHTIGLRHETSVLLPKPQKKGTRRGLNTELAERGPNWPLLNCLLNNNAIFYMDLTPSWHCLGNVQYLHSYHNSFLAQLHSEDVLNWHYRCIVQTPRNEPTRSICLDMLWTGSSTDTCGLLLPVK